MSGCLDSPKECNIFEQEVCLSRLLISLFIIIFLLLEMKTCINKIKYHISGGTRHPKYLPIIGLQQKKGNIQSLKGNPKNCSLSLSKDPHQNFLLGAHDGGEPPQKCD